MSNSIYEGLALRLGKESARESAHGEQIEFDMKELPFRMNMHLTSTQIVHILRCEEA